MVAEVEIRRVLIANRGEIAVRVIRTLREQGVESVAVYSDVDRLALHVLLADRAVPIGGAAAADSYLVIDKIIAACRESGADAVHPGYGFLSENPLFAEALEAEGIALLGPPAAAMRLMGSKTAARAAVFAAGTPVVPGESGPEGAGLATVAAAASAAARIGYPVLVKAAAGGGGKGMRRVERPEDLASAFAGAQREATSSFGDGTVYLEKAIDRPRHVEIQIFADAHGNVVHLGERDCSIQRRHQKIIEEAPSPAVDETLRAAMGAAAVAAAKACDYRGAGTVEFLLAGDSEFYFLEMNTRLQVEHPVTEVLYGLDLVAWQLAVARGEALPMTQAELDASRRGAAIECRIYAEDPVRFLPSPGTLTQLRTPAGPYVRDDSGVYEGVEITSYYDPLLSKLVVWGRDRREALSRMRAALAEYLVAGIETNLAFHRRMLANPNFCAGHFDTGFVEREESLRAPASEDHELAVVAAVACAPTRGPVAAPLPVGTPSPSRWRSATGLGSWRQ